MIARRLACCFALVAGWVCGQSDSQPEIRGTVIEPGLDLGVPGAQITLFEFVLDAQRTVVRTPAATTSTGARGEFRFPLQHFGNYYVEAHKDSYIASLGGPGANPNESTGSPVDVDANHPSRDLRFSLMRPGEITGRVLDEDGQAIAGLHITAQSTALGAAPPGFGPGATTDKEGLFTTSKLPPGQYLLRISPKAGEFETVIEHFTDQDLKVVDQDIESAYWPGGATDAAAALKIPVSPGASSSVGTITVRRVPYYRAHVSVAAPPCGPNDKWMFTAIPVAESAGLHVGSVPCGRDFLVGNLKPGSYWFILTGDGKPTRQWAYTPVEIKRDNVEAGVTIAPATQVHGRVVAAEGASLPALDTLSISAASMAGAMFINVSFAPVDAHGDFLLKDVYGLGSRVTVARLADRYYVKEIRVNGVTSTDGMIALNPGAPSQELEIVIDDKPATITGSVRDGDRPAVKSYVLVVKWPMRPGDAPLSPDRPAGDDQGKFRISGLPPGEYRVLSFSSPMPVTRVSSILWSLAERVTLQRGDSQDVSLKLVNPVP